MRKPLSRSRINIESVTEADKIQINAMITTLEENTIKRDILTIGTYQHFDFSGVVKVKIVGNEAFGE